MKMLRINLLFVLLFTTSRLFPQIIPQPVQMMAAGDPMVLTPSVTIGISGGDTDLTSDALYLQNRLMEITGISPSIDSNGKLRIDLIIIKDKQLGSEGYRMSANAGGIRIEANGTDGIFYGIQSLLQLLPPVRTNAAPVIPGLMITDYPRFEWRGMHLDVSRHFFDPATIKEYIDLMATYKMNTFHWHLVDDQGWRIEIRKYPELTNTGAWRVDKTAIPWRDRPQAEPGEEADYGGYYTQEQLKEIVAYASERHITIVPEIEMPGHEAAAIASYPFLSCSGKSQLPLTGGNYRNTSSNFCAGNDSVFIFLQDVLDEVMAIFPSHYIHIGGDEVDKSDWKSCTRCQQRMKDEQLKSEEELQSYFIHRMEKYVNEFGRSIIGWDEILEGGLAPNATVMSWRGESGGIEAVRMGHQAIMTPGTPCYFDHYQAGPEGEPLAIGGYNSLEMVYRYNPVPEELTPSESKLILGAQGNVWAEFITTRSHLEYMVLPRMLALAEVLWTPDSLLNWERFQHDLKKQFKAFDYQGLNYCGGNYNLSMTPSIVDGHRLITISTEIPEGEIYYSTDGRMPGLTDNLYKGPIMLDTSALLKAVLVINGKIMSREPSVLQLDEHKALGCNVRYTNPVSRHYPGDGDKTLTDGIRGNNQHQKHWQGISDQDFVATVDMGEVTDIQSLGLGCLHNYGRWIFLPQEVTFEVSMDGISFQTVARITNPFNIDHPQMLHTFMQEITVTEARYVRVTAINNDCPPGHPGAGHAGWIFVDEIIVQ